MRSAVWIGAALGLLTVRLLAGGNVAEAPAPATARAADAAAALLAGVVSGAEPFADAGSTPAGHMAGVAHAMDALPAASAPVPSERSRSAGRAMRVAAVEAQVQAQRRQGAGEEAVYQARATQLPQAELAQLMAMETAEADWRRQMEACRTGNCDPAQGSQGGNAGAYRQAATPQLTMK